MHYEYSQAYEFRAEVLYHFLKTVIISIGRQFEYTKKPVFALPQPALVTSFYRLLDEHYVEKKRVKDYAGLLAISPNYLNAVLKDLSGYTASYHIQRRILSEAKRRILSERTSLKEIAYKLGFCDPAHFSKFFKNAAGFNFKEFKKQVYSIVERD
jgi:AraC family transcriptional activator of pobA